MNPVRFSLTALFLLISILVLSGCDTGGTNDWGRADSTTLRTINLNGGDGDNGAGGIGNSLSIESYRDIVIQKTGTVDASFTIPSIKPRYVDCSVLEEGPSDPMEQFRPASDVTVIAMSPGDTGFGNGGYYLMYGDNTLYYDIDGDGSTAGAGDLDDEDVDCIDISGGITVTLGLNHDHNGDADNDNATGADTTVLFLDSDLRVSGTLKVATLDTAADPDVNAGPGIDSGALQINARQIFVRGNGTVSTEGADNTSGRGGNGGQIRIKAVASDEGFFEVLGTIDCSGGNGTGGEGGYACARSDGSGTFTPDYLYLWSNGRTVVRGSILANGGNGDAGNNGGDGAHEVDIMAEVNNYITGTVEANGGKGGPAGYGGNGSYVLLYTDLGELNIAGNINANGGDGGYGGGDSDTVDIYNGYASPFRNKANISLRGGNSTVDGDGGNGGQLLVNTYGGPLLFAGNFNGRGGDAMGAGSSGGDGSQAVFIVNDSSDYGYGEVIGPSDIEISANMDLSGGDGDSGGNAGNINILNNADLSGDVFPPAGRVLLKGYRKFDMSGGDSVANNGGNAGELAAVTDSAYSSIDDGYVVGSIMSSVPMDLSGGDGALAGGQGGYFFMEAEGETYMRDTDATVARNTADLNLSGGNGDVGGDSGGFYIYGYNEARNTGDLNLTGGAGTSQGGAGLFENVEMYSTEDVANLGRIDGNGGNATTDGGNAFNVSMYAGHRTRNVNSMDASGGDAATNGGDGGFVDLFSQGAVTWNTASIDVGGGAGVTRGAIGSLFIDLTDMTDYIDGKL